MLAPTSTMRTVFTRIALLILLLPCIAVVGALVAFLFSYIQDARAGRKFEEVQQGASRQQVIALLGQPTRIRACGENLWWGDDANYRGKNDGRCVTEERYEYFLSAWGIGYSTDGQVVSKYHYVSE
jgi:hypothetical protein